MERVANHSRIERAGVALVLSFLAGPFLVCSTARPADLASHKNLRLWLKADAITGVADGAPLARWDDASKAQAHGTQDMDSRRPTFRASALNGKPAVVFDGTRSAFRLPDDSVIGRLRDMDMFAVFAKASNVGYDTLFGGGYSGDAPLVGTNGDFLTFYHSGSSPSELKAAKTLALSTFVLVEYFKEVADVMIFLNGAVAATGRLAPPSSGSSGEGARYVGGDNGSEMFDGSLAELAFFDTALSDEERRDVRCYLAAKYALTAASQDCGHR